MAFVKVLVAEQPAVAIQIAEESRDAGTEAERWGLSPVEMSAAAVLAGLLSLPGVAVLYVLVMGL